MSLADVMSEELADQLQKKEYRHIDQAEAAPSTDTGAGAADTGPDIPPDIDYDTSDDAMIAMMLQKQFDKEADLQLAKEEQSLNRNSKVTVTYSKYRMIPEEWAKYDSSDEVRSLHRLKSTEYFTQEDEDEYFTMDEARRDLDFFATKEKEMGEMPKCGLKKVGDKIVSKHDKELSQRENAKRIMEFPPGIHTGDGGSFDMQVQLSNLGLNVVN